MHPDLSVTVSKYFYQNELRDSNLVANRAADAIWARFKQLAFPEQALHHSYFVSTNCTEIYRSRTKRSLMNPAHLYYTPHVINKLRQAGAADSQIAYQTTYRGQMGLMRSTRRSIAAVDQAQGREYDFVVPDMVTPGGRFFPLGFASDPRRMCVASSRARIGMIVLGNKDMGDVKYPGSGSKIWRDVIKDRVDVGALREMNMPNVAPLLEGLEIPGRFWEVVEPQALDYGDLGRYVVRNVRRVTYFSSFMLEISSNERKKCESPDQISITRQINDLSPASPLYHPALPVLSSTTRHIALC